MGTWNYTYDPVGNLLTQSDARGCVTTLSYDQINRLLGKHYRSDDACPGSPTYNVEHVGCDRRNYVFATKRLKAFARHLSTGPDCPGKAVRRGVCFVGGCGKSRR